MARQPTFKLIVLLFVALWLFNKGGRQLGYLKDPRLAQQIMRSNGDPATFQDSGTTVSDLVSLSVASGFSATIALIVGLAICLFICRKRKWHWLHPTFSAFNVYCLNWFALDTNSFVAHLLLIPGEQLSGYWYYLINGIVPIALGILVLFFTANRLKSNGQSITVEPQSA